MKILSTIALAAVLCACASTKPDRDLDELVSWMTGSFSSEKQSIEDPEFFDIRLEMVRIWPARTDGCWLYVEQAAASALDQPYRQRVYRLTRLDGETIESAVFELDEPLQYAGVWKEEAPLSHLTPVSLKKRQGASIYLKKIDRDTYAGSTRGKECKSDYRGAAYATSEVTITSDRIYSWDRGYDASDRQVWGAVKGGYFFLRR